MAVVSGGLAYGVGSLAKVGISLLNTHALITMLRGIYGRICNLQRPLSTRLTSRL